MTPEGLRCESSRPVRRGFGLGQYSLAMLIVLAAILDALWWVPAHQAATRRFAGAIAEPATEPAVPTRYARCRRMQIDREIARRQAEIARLEAERAALPSE